MTIKIHNDGYFWTDESPSSRYNLGVVVDPNGLAYGPSDIEVESGQPMIARVSDLLGDPEKEIDLRVKLDKWASQNPDNYIRFSY